jgi:hypothetical protein
MITEPPKNRLRPRPPRGFPAEAPPGFAMGEGRGFILVWADRMRELGRRAIGAATGRVRGRPPRRL